MLSRAFRRTAALVAACVYLVRATTAAAPADGDRFAPGLKKFARLARLIERSGRRVLFTVDPTSRSSTPRT